MPRPTYRRLLLAWAGGGGNTCVDTQLFESLGGRLGLTAHLDWQSHAANGGVVYPTRHVNVQLTAWGKHTWRC